MKAALPAASVVTGIEAIKVWPWVSGGIVGDNLEGECGTGNAAVSSHDGDVAATGDSGGEYGGVLEVVCTDVSVARIIGGDAVVAEVDA